MRFIYVVIFTFPLGIAVGAPIPGDSKGKEKEADPLLLPWISYEDWQKNLTYFDPLPAKKQSSDTQPGIPHTPSPHQQPSAQGHSTPPLTELRHSGDPPRAEGQSLASIPEHSTRYLEDDFRFPELRHHHSGNPPSRGEGPSAQGHSNRLRHYSQSSNNRQIPQGSNTRQIPQRSNSDGQSKYYPNADYSSKRPRLGDHIEEREKTLLSLMKKHQPPESDEPPKKKQKRGDDKA